MTSARSPSVRTLPTVSGRENLDKTLSPSTPAASMQKRHSSTQTLRNSGFFAIFFIVGHLLSHPRAVEVESEQGCK